MCVLLRNRVEIWIDQERLPAIERALETKAHFELDGSIIAASEVSGVFTPAHMEEYKRVQQGQWKCRWGHWHDRGELCEHIDPARAKKKVEADKKFYEEHGYLPLH